MNKIHGPTPHHVGRDLENGCIASFDVADATNTGLADSCVDLIVGSPPYLEARDYAVAAARDLKAWINDLMIPCTAEALRVCRGLVVWIVAGQTIDGCYVPGPETLVAEAFARPALFPWGVELWRPAVWYKVDPLTGGGCGQPGSGGKQGLRSDWEYCLMFKRPGVLPWADPRFECRPPKCAPGGKIRTRAKSGARNPRAFVNPTWTNPGNVLKARVGGGHQGDKECHRSHAPYPERVPAFFIQAYCPPGGWVYDPYSGSGTTVCEAVALGRNGYGTDLDPEQIKLGLERLDRRVREGRSVRLSPWPRRIGGMPA